MKWCKETGKSQNSSNKRKVVLTARNKYPKQQQVPKKSVYVCPECLQVYIQQNIKTAEDEQLAGSSSLKYTLCRGTQSQWESCLKLSNRGLPAAEPILIELLFLIQSLNLDHAGNI